jgi:hypothetical protein
LINSSKSPAFVSLVVLKAKRNANFSFSGLVEAIQNTLICARYVAEYLPSGSKVPPNKWVLFGGSAGQGNATGYLNTRLDSGAYFLVGSGENSVSDCDVEVLEQYAAGNPEGKLVSRNTGSTYPFDFGVFVPDTSKNYRLRVNNKTSQKSSAFVFGFLIQAQ